MDIIAMQTANKVLRRMNREFNGMYDAYVAKAGQTIFETSKAHDTEHHGLHVYVNGFHAIEGQDYVHLNSIEIEFKKSLNAGDVVLLTTQVVGVPKVEGQAYDDTEVQAKIAEFTTSISNLSTKVANIIAAIDEDGDGEIVDTIADLKAQWEEADGDLKDLIAGKASLEQLQTLSEAIALKASMSELTTLQETVANKAEVTDVEALEEQIQNMSTATTLTDEETGRPYVLAISGGNLSAKLDGVPSAITINAPETGVADGNKINIEFQVGAGCDAGQAIKLEVRATGDSANVLELIDMTLDSEVEQLADMSFAGELLLAEAGEVVITVTMKRKANDYVLATATHTIAIEEYTAPEEDPEQSGDNNETTEPVE